VIALEAVSTWLRRRRIHWTLAAAALGTLAAVVYLPIPWAQLWTSGALPPGMSIGGTREMIEVARRAAPLVLETVAMAWCATIAAAVVAFAIAPIASRTLRAGSYLPDPPRARGISRAAGWLVLAGARLGFQIARAMPELTLALLVVMWVGPGAFAGALAIGLHTIGVLGRLYTDIYEEAERGPAAVIEASGASRLAIWMHGVLPQVMPRLLAFTLYRFEVNVRMTVVVGFAGAGGIGDAISTAISLFHVTDLVFLLLVMVAVVTALDWAGDRVRHRILVGRFAAVKRKPNRLTHYRVDPEPQGDPNAQRENQTGRSRDPDRSDAVVRLLGAGED